MYKRTIFISFGSLYWLGSVSSKSGDNFRITSTHDRTSRSYWIGNWHDDVVSLSVRLSVTMSIVAKTIPPTAKVSQELP